jgi:hypothetical protein
VRRARPREEWAAAFPEWNKLAEESTRWWTPRTSTGEGAVAPTLPLVNWRWRLIAARLATRGRRAASSTSQSTLILDATIPLPTRRAHDHRRQARQRRAVAVRAYWIAATRRFGPRVVCTKCGTIGGDARPNWTERKR